MDELCIPPPKGLITAKLHTHNFGLFKELECVQNVTGSTGLSFDILDGFIENLLENRINSGDEDAHFQLGQIYFEAKRYAEAWKYFVKSWETFQDQRARYQMAVMLYDGLVKRLDHEKYPLPKKKACEIFEEIAKLGIVPKAPAGLQCLVQYAAYNLGKAYYQGCGVYASAEKAIQYFELAANNGDPRGCVEAQTALGYIYSRAEHLDLKKAFYWHTEACGNGNVESQTAIGVMYLHGLGVKQDWSNALFCLCEAVSRGGFFAKAHLCYFYYKRKIYTSAALIANKFISDDMQFTGGSEFECLQDTIDQAKAMIYYLYARCLQRGVGVETDEFLAKTYFDKSVWYHPATASRFQRMTQHDEL